MTNKERLETLQKENSQIVARLQQIKQEENEITQKALENNGKIALLQELEKESAQEKENTAQ